ncbi:MULTISPECIES: hypothetical protein [Aquincola]|uniref:hypothetical protein n=1 Tax=Aquincola TaxID=391952 RepID=UPI00061505C9|nr:MULTISPECIES: hypothetical protein [Aquincola]MCR5866006.1 hypothetical protein [Aquincola sp. J276]
MSHTTATLPLKPAAPAKAPVGAWLRKAGAGVWKALEGAGQRRAEAELAQFAALHASQFPELASFARKNKRAG